MAERGFVLLPLLEIVTRKFFNTGVPGSMRRPSRLQAMRTWKKFPVP